MTIDIPERTDESIGRVKIDKPRALPAVVDKRWDVPAEEHNRALDAIVEAATHIADLDLRVITEAVANASITQYQVVHVLGTGVAGVTPVVDPALATSAAVLNGEALFLALTGADVNKPCAVAAVVIVAGLTVAGSPATDAAIYVTDTGTLSTAPGTNTRRVGKILRFSSGVCTVAFDGQAGVLGAAVPAARKINTGTGITGGGDLTADRTLAADFGTASGKVAQGNDGRFPTSQQKNALAGTGGTPDTGNEYTTRSGALHPRVGAGVHNITAATVDVTTLTKRNLLIDTTANAVALQAWDSLTEDVAFVIFRQNGTGTNGITVDIPATVWKVNDGTAGADLLLVASNSANKGWWIVFTDIANHQVHVRPTTVNGALWMY